MHFTRTTRRLAEITEFRARYNEDCKELRSFKIKWKEEKMKFLLTVSGGRRLISAAFPARFWFLQKVELGASASCSDTTRARR